LSAERIVGGEEELVPQNPKAECLVHALLLLVNDLIAINNMTHIPKSSKPRAHTEKEWEGMRLRICYLYTIKDHSLFETRDILLRNHNFNAT